MVPRRGHPLEQGLIAPCFGGLRNDFDWLGCISLRELSLKQPQLHRLNLLIELDVPLYLRLDPLLHYVDLNAKAVGLSLELSQLVSLLLNQSVLLHDLLPRRDIALERLCLLRVESLILLLLRVKQLPLPLCGRGPLIGLLDVVELPLQEHQVLHPELLAGL